MEDLYKILGVQRNVDAETLKRTYKELAKKYHPDRNQGDKIAEEKFKQVSNAYEIISDPQKKALYDRGEAPMNGGAYTGGMHTQAHYGTGPFAGYGFRTAQPDDLFADIFGPMHTRRSAQQVYQNQHINLNYQITLEEAFTGKEADVAFTFKGKINQKLRVTIPTGIENGMRIRFLGKGDDSLKGIPAGDLFITVGIIPHPKFQRIEHLTLLTTETITYLDAILGCEREIRTIDGTTINMEVPTNVTEGMILKVSGKGMKDVTGRRGDLLVELKLVPPTLTAQQRSILTSIQNELKVKT